MVGVAHGGARFVVLLGLLAAVAGCDVGAGGDGETNGREPATARRQAVEADGVEVAVADVRLEETLRGRHGRTLRARPGETFLVVVARLRNRRPEGGLDVRSRRAEIVDEDGEVRRAGGGGDGEFCLCPFFVNAAARTASFTFVFALPEPLPKKLSFRYDGSDLVPLRLPASVASTRERGGWTKVEPGGRTTCARGTPYAFWFRGGSPDKLLVYFQAGGGCFDVRSCSPGSALFDDSVTPADDPATESGILDLDDPRNPFRGYSVLYVPSCTGDVHWGDKVRTYGGGGSRVTIRHRGFVNARAALEWVYERVPSPREIFVTGCSAGSVGSAAHVPFVIERYDDARVAQLGDSLTFVFHRPVDLDEDYGAGANFPRWIPAVRRIDGRRFTMARYSSAVARHYPDAAFSQFNYANDRVQRFFYEAAGGDGDDFAGDLRASLAEIRRNAPNFRCYTAPGDGHCILNSRDFYSHETEGVPLRDWVAALARGRPVRNVESR